MFFGNKGFNPVGKLNHAPFIVYADNGALVNRIFKEDGCEGIPWVFFQLLVTQAETTSFGIDFQDHDVQHLVLLDELRRVVDFLGPRKIANVHEAVHTLSQFYKKTEIGQIANPAAETRSNRELFADGNPRILGQLLHTQGHFAVLFVNGENNSLNRIPLFDEILGIAQVL